MSKIKDLPKVDLPREKLARYGTEKLADYELLAILLGSGTKGLNVLQLSKRILKMLIRDGAEKITFEELLKTRGLGKAKASQIIAVIELGKRLQSNRNQEILSPEDVWKSCMDFRDSKKEHFVAFYLDTQNRLIERQIISIGTLNASLVHPREVFEPAVALHSASIIIAHNHPSGDLEPSPEDVEMTKKLVHAGKILDMPIFDHVIVTKDIYQSMKTLFKLENQSFDWS
ncbi:MAG: DNA repair protein RadC [Candidatus Moranbacteria bacterium]|nr:DNA repair protein RadC [Candidatus Moranbacteria bacterium]MDD3965074.1 DNA repair protein RadC [Candidatus Moranbacteria bacterium]